VKKYVILLDRATPEERAAVQSAIKEKARGWWHHFQDSWIVSGETAKFWRDLVKENLNSPQSAVLVLSLPEEKAKRGWAYFGPRSKDKTKWLHENYR
jgi:hypothetical protein